MNNKPLILHILPTLRRGGAERIAIELCARLPGQGFRTKLLTLFDGGTLWGEVRDRDIPWMQCLGSHAGSRIKLVRMLLKRIYEDVPRRPAIVHTHLFGGDLWTMAARTLHTAGWGMLHDRSTDRPVFVSTAHNIDRDDTALRRSARRWAARRENRIVAISKEVGEYVSRDLGVPRPRIDIIPNGIDIDAIPMREPSGPDAAPRLLVTGRLEPQKGHSMLFRALADVPPPWTLDLIGAGSQERELKELAERLGIASRVRFQGERDDASSWLVKADLFLFPSQWEGMGLALLEAMAARVPALASDLPSIREYAPKRMLVPADDVAAWTAAIRRMLEHHGSAVEDAAALSTQIRGRYTIDRMVRSYAALYRKLLQA